MEVHEFGKENSQKIVLIPGNMAAVRAGHSVVGAEISYHRD